MEKTALNPRIGMLATIRNRRAIISSVEPYDTIAEGRLHLVNLEYIDQDGNNQDTVIWEKEINPHLLEPNALPEVSSSSPMINNEFKAFQRAVRWTALSPFLNISEGQENLPLPVSPFFGAIQTEDFQLVPLLRALQMPRISLLLADDVGLGKTIEAGLILNELLLRRRIRRVLILSPASLRYQWQQEMKSKFSLNFDIIDRNESIDLQKRLGFDANPWRTYPRIITSYHYLKQPDVLEKFRIACQQPDGSARLPWDLLIVDEVHNLRPSNFGEDSQLSKMLRSISPYFEHKIFLTATPHNGYTRCFTGLLETLDPVRFNQTGEITPEIKKRIDQVLIRRLKHDINTKDELEGKQPRFASRYLEPISLYFGKFEKALLTAFEDFRISVRKSFSQQVKKDQIAGSFALEILNKRLLSCPYTFANSWNRFKEGLSEELEADVADVYAARKSIEEDIDDDLEYEGRALHAARITGLWFKPFQEKFSDKVEVIDKILQALDLDNSEKTPLEDERLERLILLIKKHLRQANKWLDNERLIIFTEYKTTLDYIAKRLKKEFKDENCILELYGGMDDQEREEIKLAFNDPNHAVKVLIATDTASEGQNLQETARYLLHYDIPWNPSRLEQRNGRLDRHGQARDVTIFHFTSDDDADIKFLSRVIEKVNNIREDLGLVSELFDSAFEKRFTNRYETDSVIKDIDKVFESKKPEREVIRNVENPDYGKFNEIIKLFTQELDITPDTLKSTLEVAMSIGIGLPRFEKSDERGSYKLLQPIPSKWKNEIDENLRTKTSKSGYLGALYSFVFNPDYFIDNINGRQVFRNSKDTLMLHLGHPLYTRALSLFARARFPGGRESQGVNRWIAYYGEVPTEYDYILQLTVEEIAINNLRENFHHWTKTLRLLVKNEEIGPALPHLPASFLQYSETVEDKNLISELKGIWNFIKIDLQKYIKDLESNLEKELKDKLKEHSKEAIKDEKELFNKRLKEIEKGMQDNTIDNLEKEKAKLLKDMRQTSLFQEYAKEKEEELKNLNEELEIRKKHFIDLKEHVEREQERVINNLLPGRYALKKVHVFPVTVEFIVPRGR